MNQKDNKTKTPLDYIKRFLNDKIFEIKTKILDMVNFCYCPFQPDDVPFPQSCDKRIIYTEECKKCPWRKWR